MISKTTASLSATEQLVALKPKPVLAFVIPAFQPNATLLQVARGILERAVALQVEATLIVVDDGSSPEREPLFAQLAKLDRTRVLRHAVNLGKGAALKTAFNQALVTYGDRLVGAITADADGQHLPSDVLAVAEALLQAPSELVIGSRSFDASTPLRSRVGNVVTRSVFRLFTGRRLQDTQSGLRGIPRELLRRLLRIPTQGYDYELEMLVSESHRGTRFLEQPIATIYEPGNPSSHFNPLLDSAKIYYVFVRFSALALCAGGLDYLVFVLALKASGYILFSIATARLVTGVFYFQVARSRVFQSGGSVQREAIKFTGLVLASMLASYGLITLQVILLHFPAPAAKVLSDLTLFLANFAVQRLFVFRPRSEPA